MEDLTFDEWWEACNYDWLGYQGADVDIKAVARRAWEAGRLCNVVRLESKSVSNVNRVERKPD